MTCTSLPISPAGAHRPAAVKRPRRCCATLRSLRDDRVGAMGAFRDQGLRRAKPAARGRFAASKALKTDRLIRPQRSSLAEGGA